jgi:hydroxyethylthiazole kinase-like uncharacterized protein yjeF
MRILTAGQMREAERRTVEDVGIPARVLMENAGRQVAAAIENAFEELDVMRVSVLSGRGNNGGDGFVVARVLVERGVETHVYLIGSVEQVQSEARANLDSLRALDIDVVEIADLAAWELMAASVLAADLVVDALYGTGFHGTVSGLIESVIADVNASSCPVVAVDLPSGLSADSPVVDGAAIEATLTIALGAPKLSLVMPPAERHAGALLVADIGIPGRVIEQLEAPRVELITADGLRPLVAARPSDSHKGSYGRILIVAGSTGRTGAAILAGRAALRSGAGLVTVATPHSCLPVVAGGAVEYMTISLPETGTGQLSAEAIDLVLAHRADVIAVGPGLGTDPGTVLFVQQLVERSGVPLVLDADALNAFVDVLERLNGRTDVPVMVTPHPGEMARLLGTSVARVQSDRLAAAVGLAISRRLHVVLKGHRTIAVDPDGSAAINLTGNPGMATAGSGDVLAGVLAAWYAQLQDPAAACRLAVYLHGAAGDLAQQDRGEQALVAGDIISHLGDAVQDLQQPGRRKAADRG